MHDIKSGYYLELLTPEAMKLFEITEEKITKNKNGKTVPHVEITEVVLVHCNIINKKYQNDLRVLSTLIPNKSLNISPANHIYSKTFCSVSPYTKVWFTDQNSKSPTDRRQNKFDLGY